MTNPLIQRHQDGNVKGYPMPDDYEDFDAFLRAHVMWLQELRMENAAATNKVIDGIKNKERDSTVLQYLSGILHIRKEYAAFLTKGIEASEQVLGY